MTRTAAIMMAVSLAVSAVLAVASVVAATSAPSKAELAQLFGAQLDCSTERAIAFAGGRPVDGGDIMKAVDGCMSTVSLAANTGGPVPGFSSLAVIPLRDSELRREALVLAVRERVELCANLGIPPAHFAAACPRIFTLEQAMRAETKTSRPSR